VGDGDLTEQVLALGRSRGLDAVGVAAATVFVETRQALFDRRAAGLHGGMQFTYRNPERSTDPGRLVDGARSIVVGARSYLSAGREASVDPAGRVARYSWRDHYAELRAALEPMATRLRGEGWKAVVVADDNALVDREAAYRAGIGWYGKSSNLLLPGRGSWFVLGSVVTNAPLTPASAPQPDGCGPCHSCIDACPTQAIVAPGVVDARRCLAWLVQAPGSFPLEWREALGDRIYGCDDCQEVCPPNRVVDRHQTASRPDSGDEPWVDLVALLDASDDEVVERFGRWYIAGREARYLRRNALVALGNTADGQDHNVERVLGAALSSGDVIVREHAEWAARRLGRSDLVVPASSPA
jgi:epoxyqueuosine reductase